MTIMPGGSAVNATSITGKEDKYLELQSESENSTNANRDLNRFKQDLSPRNGFHKLWTLLPPGGPGANSPRDAVDNNVHPNEKYHNTCQTCGKSVCVPAGNLLHVRHLGLVSSG